jgi:hypothetical protein
MAVPRAGALLIGLLTAVAALAPVAFSVPFIVLHG